MNKTKQFCCVTSWLCFSSGNNNNKFFIIYHTCCLCFREDIWILRCHHLNCSGTNPSPSPVTLSTVCQGQCAWNRWTNLVREPHLWMRVLFYFGERKVTKSWIESYQTPREIPSSDVRYMLMVWLREKSAGWQRSTKNGTLTAEQKYVNEHWGGFYGGSDKKKIEFTYFCECIQSAGSSPRVP